MNLGAGSAAFTPYKQPTDRYTRGSCLIDLSKIDDYTDRRKVGGCGTHVTLSKVFVKLSVPHTWRTWSCPPVSETCRPDLLYSDHGTTAATIDFGARLFAAKAKPGFRSAVITMDPDGDFGIARIRV